MMFSCGVWANCDFALERKLLNVACDITFPNLSIITILGTYCIIRILVRITKFTPHYNSDRIQSRAEEDWRFPFSSISAMKQWWSLDTRYYDMRCRDKQCTYPQAFICFWLSLWWGSQHASSYGMTSHLPFTILSCSRHHSSTLPRNWARQRMYYQLNIFHIAWRSQPYMKRATHGFNVLPTS